MFVSVTLPYIPNKFLKPKVSFKVYIGMMPGPADKSAFNLDSKIAFCVPKMARFP